MWGETESKSVLALGASARLLRWPLCRVHVRVAGARWSSLGGSPSRSRYPQPLGYAASGKNLTPSISRSASLGLGAGEKVDGPRKVPAVASNPVHQRPITSSRVAEVAQRPRRLARPGRRKRASPRLSSRQQFGWKITAFPSHAVTKMPQCESRRNWRRGCGASFIMLPRPARCAAALAAPMRPSHVLWLLLLACCAVGLTSARPEYRCAHHSPWSSQRLSSQSPWPGHGHKRELAGARTARADPVHLGRSVREQTNPPPLRAQGADSEWSRGPVARTDWVED